MFENFTDQDLETLKDVMGDKGLTIVDTKSGAEMTFDSFEELKAYIAYERGDFIVRLFPGWGGD